MSANSRGIRPGPNTEGKICHFGKWYGTPWEDVPSDYLVWLSKRKRKNQMTGKAIYELNRRKAIARDAIK